MHQNKKVAVVAAGWFLIIAIVVLLPALAHGGSFGSFDLLSRFGLLARHGVAVHNVQAGDQSDAIIPWAALSWTQVHHGQLPLWNPFEALGMPLAFNWQSASFSVPSLIGYLFPYNLAYTAQVVVTLFIAGTGIYALGRVLGLGVLSCIFGGTVFELSGPMLGWLGWPHAAVMSWAGWLFAAALLILQDRRGVRYVAGFALVLAAMIYAGQPEVLTLFALALAIFAAVILVVRTVLPQQSGPVRAPLLNLSIATAIGLALGAPLLLPGLQVVGLSQHAAPGGDPVGLVKGNPPLPLHNLIHLLLQGFDGLPIAGSHWFGYAAGYSETAAYLGVIPVVLAILAVTRRRMRPEPIGIVVFVVAMAVLAFLSPASDALSHLPVIGTLVWQRALLPLVFGLVVLSAIGMDALTKNPDQKSVHRWLAGGFLGVLALLAAVWLFGGGHLDSTDSSIRRASFVWPVIEITVGLGATAALAWLTRREGTTAKHGLSMFGGPGRWVGSFFLIIEAAFLVTAGSPLWTSSSVPFPPTPSVLTLKQAVGTSVVGLGASRCLFPPGLGIPANAQVAYGVEELAAYDPSLPRSYFSSWKVLTHRSGGDRTISAYCPAITSVHLARLYGIGFLLEPPGAGAPKGTQFIEAIGRENLYRVPDSSVATATPLTTARRDSAGSPPATPVPVIHPNPDTWKLTINASEVESLKLRLTDLPGWHLTIDGRPGQLSRFEGVMLQTIVPAGRHTVVVTYWPMAFTVGIWLASIASVGLLLAFVVEGLRARRLTKRGVGEGPTVDEISDFGLQEQ